MHSENLEPLKSANIYLFYIEYLEIFFAKGTNVLQNVVNLGVKVVFKLIVF